MRFGNYLIGIDASDTTSYQLLTPAGFTSAPDLISGDTDSGTVTVLPNSSVVLYLNSNVDPAPVPYAPLLVTASGSTTQVSPAMEAAASGRATGV